jgi:hypothetical protein
VGLSCSVHGDGHSVRGDVSRFCHPVGASDAAPHLSCPPQSGLLRLLWLQAQTPRLLWFAAAVLMKMPRLLWLSWLLRLLWMLV